MQYNVISADNHIMEPRDLFVTQMPKEYRDRAPRVVRGKDGGDGWSYDGKPPSRTFGLEATAGRSTQLSGYKWEDILPGNYDPAAHVKDMADDGIDAAVLFPSIAMGAYELPDQGFALAMMQTYNTWLMSEFVATDPKRLIGLPVLPVDHGMDVCVAELKRCAKMGTRAFFIPAFPSEKPYIDSHYDPMWAAAAEAGTPICLHRQNGGKDPTGGFVAQYTVPGMGVAGNVARYFSGIPPLTNFIFTGVFHRHPALKVVEAEVNFGWVPYWKFQMDQAYTQQKNWSKFPFKGMPSEYLGKNVFVTVLDDEPGFAAVASEPVLAEIGLFSIDYPHSVCLWPNSHGYIEKVAKNIDPVAKQKILVGNSMRVFNLH
jgi:predicted TIM-barrel fold metal-dependent hydrolase